ncbi:MAG: hypothetical protein JWP32_2877 [Schumannella sp.]|nr:hypothetical protein [Schumannella sp.]
MSTPNYMPEPETPREKAVAARLARQARAGSAAEHRAKRSGNAAFSYPAEVLFFEAAHPNTDPRKEWLVTTTFNVSPTRYFQRIHHLIHDDLANSLLIDPMLVNRLLDQEKAAMARRQARTLTPEG